MPYKSIEKRREHAKEYVRSPEGKAKRKKYNKEYHKRPAVKKAKLEAGRKWKRNNVQKSKIYQRKRWLKRKYDLTLDDFNALFVKQNGCCAICQKHQSELKETFQIDHNHKTEEIRGLLCTKCNWLLGMANENSDILKQAILYLEKYK